MEELQSTEILAREILEDARKKAQRILKTAEDTIQAKSAEWEKKAAAAIAELEQKYAEQKKNAAIEVMAVLPLDKYRARAKKIEELLGAAVENWFARLSREQVLALLRKELAMRLAAYAGISGSELGGEIQASFHKIERSEAQTLLKAVLPGKSCTFREIHSTAAYPELVLETEEVRIHASIGKTVDFFLGEKRAELVEALLGSVELIEEETV